MEQLWKKTGFTCIAFVLLYASLFSPIDQRAKKELESSFVQAVSVFATCKALNAGISLVQGTEVGPPGITITIGEVLDPLNDLVERFSWVMLASLTSLGIQNILMNIVSYPWFNLLFSFFIVLSLFFVWFDKKEYKTLSRALWKSTIVLAFLRLALPVMLLANGLVYTAFVEPSYDVKSAQAQLKESQARVSELREIKYSIFSKEFYSKKIEAVQKTLSEAGDKILELLIVFFFQTLFFPLVFLYALYRLVSRLFNLKV